MFPCIDQRGKPGLRGGQAAWHNRNRDNRAVEMLQFESEAVTFSMLCDKNSTVVFPCIDM